MATLTDWISVHGGEAIRERGTSWFLLPDGSKYYMLDDGTHVQYVEAPVDTLQNLQARLKFIDQKLMREEESWKRFKQECVEAASFHDANPSMCPPPPDNAFQKLHAGKLCIQELRKQQRELQREIDRHPRMKLMRAGEQARRAQSGVVAQQRNEIESLSLED